VRGVAGVQGRIRSQTDSDVTRVFRVPPVAVVDRLEFLCDAVRGRRVYDLGFVDKGLMSSKRSLGTWLHALLSESARELIGLDLDEEGVRLARSLGFDALVADCQSPENLASLDLDPADLVVAGELVEHLERPGSFLEAVKILLNENGALVLTTPNAFALANFLAALLGREVINVDHVAWHSWRTIETVLGRHGWRIRAFMYYTRQPLASPGAASVSHRLKIGAYNAFRRTARPLYRIWPSLADGMIIVAVSDPG
jgi:SAM-dependent methyltransferase